MLPKIARVFASVFDVHTWPTPLIHGSELGSDLQFLATPTAYRAMRQAAVATTSPEMRLFPMDINRESHHFWWRYGHAVKLPKDGADHRDWLIPVRCRPQLLAPEFHIQGVLAPTCGHVTVWLWPFGWASQIELRFTGPMDFDQVEPIVAALYSSASKPFTLHGANCSVSEIFKAVAAKVRADVAAPGTQPFDVLRVPRRMVIGLIGGRGEVFERFDAVIEGTSSLPRWSDDERARIVSLLGRPVGMTEVHQVGPSGSPYSTVDLGESAFAILHDQLGVVMMLHHPKDTKWTRDGQFCLLANIRASFITWAALNGLINGVEAGAEYDPLIQAAKDAYARLPSYYLNKIFQRHAHRRQHEFDRM